MLFLIFDFSFFINKPSYLFSQELAFHEEEKARNKQVEFLNFQLRFLLLKDYSSAIIICHTLRFLYINVPLLLRYLDFFTPFPSAWLGN